jgi:uncharacterized protein YutE (UPF0331/DUF86 family)
MMDKEMIEKKFDIIEENLKYLKSARKVSLEFFASDFEKIQAAKHSLQEAIEACLDIANHIIAAKGFERAEEYSMMFEILAKNNIISSRLKSNLMEMARFRNLLVHRYGDIESKKLYNILQENLSDIEGFMREIEKFLGSGR